MITLNNYVTGNAIKQLREKKGMTQAQLAERLNVSDKAVSRWETGRGFPDISLLEPIAAALGISVAELLSGDMVTNSNASGNMRRSVFYVCPVCSNVIHSLGKAVISCCGVTLPPLEADEIDEGHEINIEPSEDEYYITVDHEMTKSHYISFMAYVNSDKSEIIKLYPEGNAHARFSLRGGGDFYIYCNRHGLFKYKV